MHASQTVEVLLALGAFLLLGLVADFLGRRTLLPRVTVLLACGIAVGGQALDLIPQILVAQFDGITNVALLMIGFLLGGKLTVRTFSEDGAQLAWISICASVVTALLVIAAVLAFGVSLEVAILLGCVAAATAPAATLDTVLVSGGETRFSRLLLGIVAVDDAWALLLFSLGLASVSILEGNGFAQPLQMAAWEIGGALALGSAIGLPAAYLTGRVNPGQPMLTEALGLILICGAAALALEVSFLLAAMAMGAVIANLAAHHDYPFHEIENIEWPFLVVFFMLAGAALDLTMLPVLGLTGVAYLLARVAGKMLGAWLGATVSRAPSLTRRWIGIAMLPQAGVPIGMALLAANEYPELGATILPVVISTTVVFDLLGPVATRVALERASANEQSA